MNHTMPRRIFAAIALLVLTVSVAAGQDDSENRGKDVARLYQVHYLEINVAALLVRQECLAQTRGNCDTRMKPNNFLELLADEKTHELVTKLLERKDVPPATQVFQVTLVVADKGGGGTPDLPSHALRALNDLRDLLPFRHFRLLDSGYLRTSDRARLSLGGDLGYDAALEFRGDPTSGKPLFIEAFALEQHTIQYIPAEAGAAGTRENISRRVVSSSFSMDVGETVVVGTSKLDGGDEALIILLTAVEQ